MKRQSIIFHQNQYSIECKKCHQKISLLNMKINQHITQWMKGRKIFSDFGVKQAWWFILVSRLLVGLAFRTLRYCSYYTGDSVSLLHCRLICLGEWFLAVNHHNYENWVPSILIHNLWLIFMWMKQKKNFLRIKNSKWPTQKKRSFFKIANSQYF